MDYVKKVSRTHPGLIVMLLDDSGSMKDPLPGSSDPKCLWVERYTTNILKELLYRSTETRGTDAIVRARYFLDVIKYGNEPVPWSDSAIDIDAATQKFGSSGNSFGLGGSLGGTDTKAAFARALPRIREALQKADFKDSFPPLVFHLTDGQSKTDATLEASQVSSLTSSDGNVLIVNAFIGASTALEYAGHHDFPGYLTEAEIGSDADTLRLFRMSSVMPETVRQNLLDDGIFPAMRPNARLFFDVRTKDTLKHVIALVSSGIGSRTQR